MSPPKPDLAEIRARHQRGCAWEPDDLRAMWAHIDRLEAALKSVIARTYSWVIREETAHEIKPLMDGIREIAQEALREGSEHE